MKVNYSITGGDDLAKRLAALPNAVSRRVQIAALKKGAEPIRAEASALAPRDEEAGAPHLADNIIIQAASDARAESEGVFDGAAVFVGPQRRFFYGFFQEIGTAFHPAKPFMRPAFDSNVGRSLNIVRQELWAAIRKHLGIGGGRSTGGGNL